MISADFPDDTSKSSIGYKFTIWYPPGYWLVTTTADLLPKGNQLHQQDIG